VQALARGLEIKVGHKDGGLTVHSLRHFFRTFTTNAQIPERAVDIWMGHVGNRSTGSLYYQLSEQDSQKFIQQVPF